MGDLSHPLIERGNAITIFLVGDLSVIDYPRVDKRLIINALIPSEGLKSLARDKGFNTWF